MYSMNHCLLALIVPLVVGGGFPWPWGADSDDDSTATCPVPEVETTEASIPTPFNPLSKDELEALVGWLYSPERDLNLTDPWTRSLTVSDNYIWQVEDLKPNKTDILAYFDYGTSVPRYARVVLVEGAKTDPVVTEYFVSIVSKSCLPRLPNKVRLDHSRYPRIPPSNHSTILIMG